MLSGRRATNIFRKGLFGGPGGLPETHYLERFKVLCVAGGTMRHVLPLVIVLDGVIELCGASSKGLKFFGARAPMPFRIRVGI